MLKIIIAKDEDKRAIKTLALPVLFFIKKYCPEKRIINITRSNPVNAEGIQSRIL